MEWSIIDYLQTSWHGFQLFSYWKPINFVAYKWVNDNYINFFNEQYVNLTSKNISVVYEHTNIILFLYFFDKKWILIYT